MGYMYDFFVIRDVRILVLELFKRDFILFELIFFIIKIYLINVNVVINVWFDLYCLERCWSYYSNIFMFVINIILVYINVIVIIRNWDVEIIEVFGGIC